MYILHNIHNFMIYNLQNFIRQTIMEEIQRNKIESIISEAVSMQLNEKKKKKHKKKKDKYTERETRRKEAMSFFNSDGIKKSEILYKALPHLSKDSARSYDKYLDPKNKDYRNNAPESLIDKILNIKKTTGK